MRRAALVLIGVLLAAPAWAQMGATGNTIIAREGGTHAGVCTVNDYTASDFDVSASGGVCSLAASADIMRTNTSVVYTQLPASVWMTADGTAPTVAGAKTAAFTGTDYQNTATSSTNSINKTGLRIRSTGNWTGTGAINRGLSISATGGTSNVAIYAEDAPVWQAGGLRSDLAGYLLTNQSGAAHTASLAAGILWWYTPSFGAYGAHIGHNGSRYETQVFGASASCLSTSAGTPTSQSDFVDQLCVTSGPNLQWGNTTSTLYSWTLNGQAARSLGLARHTTSNTAGNAFTFAGGSATSGATDKDAGGFIADPGINTGTGRAYSLIKGRTTALSTGTSDGTTYDAAGVGVYKALTDNSAISVLNVTVASNTAAAGRIDYAVEVFNGTDVQIETGAVVYHVTNKAGAIANNTITEVGVQQAATSGTLTTTWAISAANPAVVSLNADSSLTPSTGYPRMRYAFHNLTPGGQAVAVQ